MSKVINEEDVKRFKETINKEKDFLAKSLTKETKIETYVQALYLGYLDASRTFGGQKKVTKNDDAIKQVAEKMQNYINGGNNDFDSIFYEACGTLCINYEMSFGQAQKIINMAFKYLYCIADGELKERFDKCHMPLDGIMLEWIRRNITDDNGNKLKKAEAWSKLPKGGENVAGSYMYYKKHVDSYCKKEDKSPLQLDFENWVTMSQTLSAEDYLKSFTKAERNGKKHINLLNELLKKSK